MSQQFYDAGEPASRKVMLATTVYENPSAAYTFSVSQSREYLHKHGIGTAYLLISGNCHVDDGRNSVVKEFLLSDCTDLIFLDADVCWEPKQLLELCGFDVPVVAGIYPYRRDDEQSKASMPCILLPGAEEKDGLLEVAGLPTGFMKIQRSVLEALYEKADKYWEKTDRRMQSAIIFERTYDKGLRLGGDLSFCRKAIEAGFDCFAATNLRLGHVAKSIVYDSLGAFLRRKDGKTLKHIADQVKSGSYDPELFAEARRAYGNTFSALEDVLTMCAVLGRKADGPILEAGSGLTTIVLAAASKEPVYSLEHDPVWAAKTEQMAEAAGVKVNVVRTPIEDGWYRMPWKAPKFALGINDGPPRTLGSRMGFFKHFGDIDTIVCDDADDVGYGNALVEWCASHNRRIDFVERAALIRRQ